MDAAVGEYDLLFFHVIKSEPKVDFPTHPHKSDLHIEETGKNTYIL